jgi:hypothetical protein
MYTKCLFCHEHLGGNAVLPTFPVGERLAYDLEKGRLWVICIACGRWNLSALEERWEASEECERRFRATPLRVSTANIGLARLPEGLEMVRIGRAVPGEIAAWRYGRRLAARAPSWQENLLCRLEHGAQRAGEAATEVLHRLPRLRLRTDLLTTLRIRARAHHPVALVPLEAGDAAVICYRHLETVEILRPERQQHLRIRLTHEAGCLEITGDAGLRTAAKLLAALNGRGATAEQVRGAMSKLEDAGRPEGYFTRITALALRTSWGRTPDAPPHLPTLPERASTAERLALQLTNRSFWARGGTGSQPASTLLRLPVVDRLALEMAASDDVERRALEGELAELEAAWREAEEIAAIADSLFPSAVVTSMPAFAV